MRGRDYGIDGLKALAIVLMVVGHAIQYPAKQTFESNLIFRLIYSFHMPLFMFISGFLVSKKSTCDFILKQFKTLIIPFLIWMIIYSFYFRRFELQAGQWGILPTSFLQILKMPSKGLWFLWTLFLIDVVYAILNKFRHFFLLSLLFVLALYCLVTLYPQYGYYGIDQVKFYYPYFVLGLLVKQYSSVNLTKDRNKVILIVAMLILEIAWRRTGSVYAFGLDIDHSATSIFAQTIRILTPVPVILLLFGLSRRLTIEHRAISWLSNNSLSIYASHFIWIYLLSDTLTSYNSTQTTINQLTTFLLTAVFTWLLISLVNRFIWLRKLLFGR